MEKQVTNKIIMVRPANFGYNAETALDNTFQSKEGREDTEEIVSQALDEFDNMVEMLRESGIEVKVFEDTSSPVKNDAVFPNNWISTHENGSIVTYAMKSPNRRLERREDLVDILQSEFNAPKRYSFEIYEEDDKYLEGTGSMILDRKNKLIYACLSQRTHVELLDKIGVLWNYDVVAFHARDTEGKDIYHTNVVMTLGEQFAAICLDCIPLDDDRNKVTTALSESRHEVIEISWDQVLNFAGNMIQINNRNGQAYIVMSEQAYKSLRQDQILSLEKYVQIIAPPIYTIEKYGGGSVRCMIAENFLPPL